MRTMLLNTAAACASVLLTAGVVAFADPANATTGLAAATPSALVRVNDLDLRSDAGRAIAARRIGRAVDAVCGSQVDRDLDGAQCRARAGDAARHALDARIAAR
jgi:UrcA family protein